MGNEQSARTAIAPEGDDVMQLHERVDGSPVRSRIRGVALISADLRQRAKAAEAKATRASVAEAIRVRIAQMDIEALPSNGVPGATVDALADAPRNVFGPGTIVSPEQFGDFHKTGSTDSYMLAFNALGPEERTSCFENLVFFQGQVGFLIRKCNALCSAQNMLDLWEGISEVSRHALGAAHCCIYEYDASTKKLVVVFDNDIASLNNGVQIPSLGTFSGDTVRERRAQFSNRGSTGDARFNSWQYKQMCKNRSAPGMATLNAIAIPLCAFGAELPSHVLELTNRTGVWDNSHLFLSSTLAEYITPAISGVWRRLADNAHKAMPQLLLTHPSAHGLTVGMREYLCDLLDADDCEIFFATPWQGWMDDVCVTSQQLVTSKSMWVWLQRHHSQRLQLRSEDEQQHAQVPRRGSLGRRRSSASRAPGRLARQTSTPTIEQVQSDPLLKDYALAYLPAGAKSLAQVIAERSRADGRPLIMRIDAPVDKHPAFNIEVDHHPSVPSAPVSSLCATLFCRPLPLGKTTDDHTTPPALFAVIELRNKRWTSSDAAKPASFGPIDVKMIEQCSMLIGSTLRQGLVAERSRFLAACTLAAEARLSAITSLAQMIGARIQLDMLFAAVTADAVRLLLCERATLWLVSDDGRRVFTISDVVLRGLREKLAAERAAAAASPVEEDDDAVTMVALNSLSRRSSYAAMTALGAGRRESIPSASHPTALLPREEHSLIGPSASLVRVCVESRDVINLRDAYADARFDSTVDKGAVSRTRSLMFVPILDKRAKLVLGVLQLVNRQDRYSETKGSHFSDDDRELARSCASTIAVALLESRAQVKREELAELMLKEAHAQAAGARRPSLRPPANGAVKSRPVDRLELEEMG